MFARSLLVCVVSGLAASASADDADAKKTAKSQAEELQTAFMKGEYEIFMRLTHPMVVESMGGKEKMATTLTAETKKMKAQGFEFKSTKVFEPSNPVRVGKELYITIPFNFEMLVPAGRVLTKSTLIGLSKDDGKTWVFLDGSGGREKVKTVLPDLPDAIVIPKREQPTLIKD